MVRHCLGHMVGLRGPLVEGAFSQLLRQCLPGVQCGELFRPDPDAVPVVVRQWAINVEAEEAASFVPQGVQVVDAVVVVHWERVAARVPRREGAVVEGHGLV
eukprot:CAMPEP_0201282348 /NCGR_PEP_ID=MMETSP1317-20130820/5380_1 /ASSEMBLY_ACC=CAM_ASM_000770 /TAXON_ID=187299 /ORGANISM="Undescribed Undescribed, Strain Undescribed" /LENGTH=101 /DNA_ID=CAMNT_0047594691 /DNA_START=63 /DNA_END=368 /DNA_ORIENTATION=+